MKDTDINVKDWFILSNGDTVTITVIGWELSDDLKKTTLSYSVYDYDKGMDFGQTDTISTIDCFCKNAVKLDYDVPRNRKEALNLYKMLKIQELKEEIESCF